MLLYKHVSQFLYCTSFMHVYILVKLIFLICCTCSSIKKWGEVPVEANPSSKWFVHSSKHFKCSKVYISQQHGFAKLCETHNLFIMQKVLILELYFVHHDVHALPCTRIEMPDVSDFLTQLLTLSQFNGIVIIQSISYDNDNDHNNMI